MHTTKCLATLETDLPVLSMLPIKQSNQLWASKGNELCMWDVNSKWHFIIGSQSSIGQKLLLTKKLETKIVKLCKIQDDLLLGDEYGNIFKMNINAGIESASTQQISTVNSPVHNMGSVNTYLSIW